MGAIGNTKRTAISNKPISGRLKVSGDAVKCTTCIPLALDAVKAGPAIVTVRLTVLTRLEYKSVTRWTVLAVTGCPSFLHN